MVPIRVFQAAATVIPTLLIAFAISDKGFEYFTTENEDNEPAVTAYGAASAIGIACLAAYGEVWALLVLATKGEYRSGLVAINVVIPIICMVGIILNFAFVSMLAKIRSTRPRAILATVNVVMLFILPSSVAAVYLLTGDRR